MGEDFAKEFDNLVHNKKLTSLKTHYRRVRESYKDREQSGTFADPLYKNGLKFKQSYRDHLSSRRSMDEDIPEDTSAFPIAYRLMKTNEPDKIILGAELYHYGGRDPKRIQRKILGSVRRALNHGASLSKEQEEKIKGLLKGGGEYGHTNRDERGKTSGLVKRVSLFFAFLLGSILGLSFLFPKISGNVIGSSFEFNNEAGILFLILGLTAGFLWIKNNSF